MNDDRRKTLRKALELLGEARSLVEEARDGEQEYRDNMLESFANGEKGYKADEVIDALDTAVSDIEGIESSIEEAIQ